jgi:putative FmdB family regulatory protein
MPLYEYYCDKDDSVFEALRSIAVSDQPVKCPKCGRDADRIMPTTFASMMRNKGLKERVPYHHHDVRGDKKKRTIARVKPKTAAAATPARKPPKPKAAATRTTIVKAKPSSPLARPPQAERGAGGEGKKG